MLLSLSLAHWALHDQKADVKSYMVKGDPSILCRDDRGLILTHNV